MIREIEVVREVPVEIIREIEVTREIDMESLMAMLSQMSTVEVSRTTKDAERVAVQTEQVMAMATEIRKDDLTIVEGIGPKIAELLNNDGIFSFEQLANASVETIQAILDKAGPRFQMHKPETWAEQSRYAAEGKFDELKVWQVELNAGKR